MVVNVGSWRVGQTWGGGKGWVLEGGTDPWDGGKGWVLVGGVDMGMGWW